MNVVEFTQLVVLLAWLATPAGTLAWMMAWTNWLRNVRMGDPTLLSPLELSFREWLESGWRKSPLFVQFFHAFVAALVPTLAFVVTTFVPAATLLRLQPYFAFLALLYISYIGSQAWYQLTKTKPVAATTVQNVFNQSAPGSGETTNATTLNAIGAPLPDSTSTPVNPRADPVPLSPTPEPGEGPVGLVRNAINDGLGSAFRGSAASAVATGVSAMNADRIPLRDYSDIALRRIRIEIENELQRRGGAVLAA